MQSSMRAINGDTSRAVCPGYSKTVTRKASFSQAAAAQRLRTVQQAATRTAPSTTTGLKLATTLSYTGRQRLPSGAVSTMRWAAAVPDIFDEAPGVLTNETGVGETISLPPGAGGEFSISSGQEAKCTFVFSELSVSVPYTLTAQLSYDDGSSWSTVSIGIYSTASYTDMQIVVEFVGGGQAGEGSAAALSASVRAGLVASGAGQCSQQAPVRYPDRMPVVRAPCSRAPCSAHHHHHQGRQRHQPHHGAAGIRGARRRCRRRIQNHRVHIRQPPLVLLPPFHHQAPQQADRQVQEGQQHLRQPAAPRAALAATAQAAQQAAAASQVPSQGSARRR